MVFLVNEALNHSQNSLFLINKWKINPHLKITHRYLQYEQMGVDSTSNKMTYKPELNITYQLNSNSKLKFHSSFSQRLLSIANLYHQVVLTSFRTYTNNDTSLAFHEKFSTGIEFKHYDWYSQFIARTSVRYEQIKNNMFSENQINGNYTHIRNFILPKTSSNFNYQFMLEKYFSPLESTIRLSANYTYLKYYNFVNHSGLRSNTGHSTVATINWQTGFDIPINFQNTFQYQIFTGKSRGRPSIQNSSMQNQLKVILKTKKHWFSTLSFEYLNPEVGDKNPYYFLGFDLTFCPNKKNWDLSLEAKNITKNNVYKDIYVSDFYKETNQQSLNKRYFLLKYSFRF